MWHNPNRIHTVQGPVVTLSAVRRRLPLTSSPMVARRNAARLIRSANNIGAAAPAARPPLLDHDSQGSDRLLPTFRRHGCRPRTSHHHNGCAALRSRHGQDNDGTAMKERDSQRDRPTPTRQGFALAWTLDLLTWATTQRSEMVPRNP